MAGFAESTFSVFNINDFEPGVAPAPDVTQGSEFENITQCAYIGYRERFEQNGAVSYEPTMSFWENIFARAIFFIVFEVELIFFSDLNKIFSTWS